MTNEEFEKRLTAIAQRQKTYAEKFDSDSHTFPLLPKPATLLEWYYQCVPLRTLEQLKMALTVFDYTEEERKQISKSMHEIYSHQFDTERLPAQLTADITPWDTVPIFEIVYNGECLGVVHDAQDIVTCILFNTGTTMVELLGDSNELITRLSRIHSALSFKPLNNVETLFEDLPSYTLLHREYHGVSFGKEFTRYVLAVKSSIRNIVISEQNLPWTNRLNSISCGLLKAYAVSLCDMSNVFRFKEPGKTIAVLNVYLAKQLIDKPETFEHLHNQRDLFYSELNRTWSDEVDPVGGNSVINGIAAVNNDMDCTVVQDGQSELIYRYSKSIHLKNRSSVMFIMYRLPNGATLHYFNATEGNPENKNQSLITESNYVRPQGKYAYQVSPLEVSRVGTIPAMWNDKIGAPCPMFAPNCSKNEYQTFLKTDIKHKFALEF